MKRFCIVTAMVAMCVAVAAAQQAYVFPSEVEPLLNSAWGQDAPYNKLCPWERADTTARHAQAGCGPVVMAQVMRGYAYPERSTLIGHAYYWSAMPDRMTDSTTTGEEDAVARLIADCGIAAGTVYGHSASSTTLNGVVTAMKKYFGYSRYMQIVDRAAFVGDEGARQWKELIYNELIGGRPVIMRAELNSRNAHVFIIDGCRDSTVHVNWGWGGRRDGYYDPDTLGGYRMAQRMVADIAPEGYTPDIRTIRLRQPGTLALMITEADTRSLRHLKLSGTINGDDLRVLRRLAGGGAKGCCGGCLSTIDMREAVILTMPDSAFYGCACLTYVRLPLTLPEISRYAFAGCDRLNRVDIPPLVSEIKRNAFAACFNLVELRLPKSLKTIGANAFNSCNSLTEVTLPGSLTSLGAGAFAHSKNLHTLTVPKTLENIGRDVITGTGVTQMTIR